LIESIKIISFPLDNLSGEHLATATPTKDSFEATREPDLALSSFQMLPGEISIMIYGFV
jgi:hypothetical protein